MFNKLLRAIGALSSLFVLAMTASAQSDLGPQTGPLAIQSSSQLNMSATVVSAIQLDISTAANGATVTGATGSSSTGVFAVNLGDVNGLGVGTPSPGVSVTTDPNGATYTTPIILTPKFSGFATNNGTIYVMRDQAAGNAAGQAATREGTAAGSVLTVADIATIITATAQNNTPITRHVGFYVSSANGVGAVSGSSLQSRLIYRLIVP